MLRYSGEDLAPDAHIVVLGSCKVGNLIVSIPALQGLRRRFPSAVIGFLGSQVTADLEQELPWIDWRWSWDHGDRSALHHLSQVIAERELLHGPITLAVNLDGFNPVTQVLTSFLSPTYVAGGALDQCRRAPMPWGDEPFQRFLSDPDWDSPQFLERYPSIFKSNYIAELFAVLAGVRDYCDLQQIELPRQTPPFPVPDILIHCTTARAAKMWPFEYWKVVVDFLVQSGQNVGLIGSAPNQQRVSYNSGSGEEWLLSSTRCQDLRGKTSLMQLAGAAALAKAVISVDAGPLHIASAVGTPTLAVVGNDSYGVGASPIRLWLPRSLTVSRTVSEATCHRCSEERFTNASCLLDHHECMLSVQPEQVIRWIEGILESTATSHHSN